MKPAPDLGQASRAKTADHPAGSGLEKQATVKNTQDLLQPEDSPSVQQSSDDPGPVTAPAMASPGEGVAPGNCQGVKPQPDLTKATKSAHFQPQATQEPVESSSGPSPDPDPTAPEHVLPVKTCAAALDQIGEHPISPGHTTQTTGNPEETNLRHPQTATGSPGTGSGPDSASEEPHVTQREHLPQPPAKSRFQKVKAKPNLTQAVRSSRSRPQVSKSSEENVSSPGLGAESRHGPVAGLTEKQRGTTLATELKMVPGVDSTESSSTPVEMKGEETADIQAETGSDPDFNPVDELPVGRTEASSKPPVRSRFQKIKPKPNVALTSRSSRTNPKVSSCDVTLEPQVHPVGLETEQTTTFLPENAASASESSLSSDAVAPPTSQENLTETNVGASGQVESSATVAEIPVPVQAAAAELGRQEKGEEPSSVCKTRRREKVKPKPHLAASNVVSVTAELSDPGTAEEVERTEQQLPSGQSQTEPADDEQKPEEPSAGEQRTDVESNQGVTSEGSGRNLPLRRRFSRVKPSLGPCARKKSVGQQPEVSEPSLAGGHSQQVATVCESLQKTEAVASGVQSESETRSAKSSESGFKSETTEPSHVENIQSEDAVQPLENSRYGLSLTYLTLIGTQLCCGVNVEASPKMLKHSL